MSIVLDAQLCLRWSNDSPTERKEFVEVELFDDGDIVIAGFDQEYHEAALEFGYPPPLELSLINYWRDQPELVISASLDIPSQLGSRIALDWAEHVLPIYKERFPHDTRPEEALAAARAYLDDPSERNDYNLRKMFIEVTKCEQEVPFEMRWGSGRYINIASVHAPNNASKSIVRAVQSADPINDASMQESVIQFAASYARIARAYKITDSVDNESPAYVAASGKEKAWQVRRFVRAMEIVGQGGKWPPMGVAEG